MAAPSTMPPFEIFRAGTHTDMGGRTLSFSAADIAAMAAAYDRGLREAPLVVGHPTHDAPAYGWVDRLEARGDTLLAHPAQTDAAFAEMVKAGRFKNRSVMLLPPGAAGNPSGTAHYVKHVGFLGAQAPAVQGLKPIAFAADEEAVQIGFMEAWQAGSIARMFRGLREWLIAEKGQEAADQALPNYAIEDVEAAARVAPQAIPAFTEPTQENHVTENLAAREAALALEATRQSEERARLDAQALAFAEREAADRAREDVTLVDRLVAEGRLLPVLRADTLAFMAALPVGEATFAFAEGQMKLNQHGAFRELLGRMPKLIPLGEIAGGEGVRKVDVSDPAAIQREALAYQERERKEGREVSDVQAVNFITQGASA